MVVMVISLMFIFRACYSSKRQQTETAGAVMRVQQLYQTQVVQFFSSHQFFYSLTRTTSWPDFFTAKPPLGKAEELVGYQPPPEEKAHKQSVLRKHYVSWDRVGVELRAPSYFIYRVEPEPNFFELSKPGDEGNPYYNFHAIAIGDLDGNGRYSLILRGAYIDRDGVFQTDNQVYTADLLE